MKKLWIAGALLLTMSLAGCGCTASPTTTPTPNVTESPKPTVTATIPDDSDDMPDETPDVMPPTVPNGDGEDMTEGEDVDRMVRDRVDSITNGDGDGNMYNSVR